MRSDLIVVSTPSLAFSGRFVEGHEPVRIEALGAELTGLLIETGASTPLVEDLIAAGSAWRRTVGMQTLLTETTDPVDPDVVRADSWLSRAGMESVLTRAQIDPIDPDFVRGSLPFVRSLAGVETIMTKFDHPDPYDPDYVRLDRYIDFIDALGTDIPKRQPDPDIVKLDRTRGISIDL